MCKEFVNLFSFRLDASCPSFPRIHVVDVNRRLHSSAQRKAMMSVIEILQQLSYPAIPLGRISCARWPPNRNGAKSVESICARSVFPHSGHLARPPANPFPAATRESTALTPCYL